MRNAWCPNEQAVARYRRHPQTVITLEGEAMTVAQAQQRGLLARVSEGTYRRTAKDTK
jgi:hypothetical protein